MQEEEQNRVDKYLWTIRIFKTRSQATEACRKGRVTIDGQPVKASRTVRPGEIVEVKKPPVNHRYEIKGIPKSRLGAKLVEDYMKDLTPKDELDKLKLSDDFFVKRDKGTGRPTKKERRLIDKLKSNQS